MDKEGGGDNDSPSTPGRGQDEDRPAYSLDERATVGREPDNVDIRGVTDPITGRGAPQRHTERQPDAQTNSDEITWQSLDPGDEILVSRGRGHQHVVVTADERDRGGYVWGQRKGETDAKRFHIEEEDFIGPADEAETSVAEFGKEVDGDFDVSDSYLGQRVLVHDMHEDEYVVGEITERRSGTDPSPGRVGADDHLTIEGAEQPFTASFDPGDADRRYDIVRSEPFESLSTAEQEEAIETAFNSVTTYDLRDTPDDRERVREFFTEQAPGSVFDHKQIHQALQEVEAIEMTESGRASVADRSGGSVLEVPRGVSQETLAHETVHMVFNSEDISIDHLARNGGRMDVADRWPQITGLPEWRFNDPKQDDGEVTVGAAEEGTTHAELGRYLLRDRSGGDEGEGVIGDKEEIIDVATNRVEVFNGEGFEFEDASVDIVDPSDPDIERGDAVRFRKSDDALEDLDEGETTTTEMVALSGSPTETFERDGQQYHRIPFFNPEMGFATSVSVSDEGDILGNYEGVDGVDTDTPKIDLDADPDTGPVEEFARQANVAFATQALAIDRLQDENSFMGLRPESFIIDTGYSSTNAGETATSIVETLQTSESTIEWQAGGRGPRDSFGIPTGNFNADAKEAVERAMAMHPKLIDAYTDMGGVSDAIDARFGEDLQRRDIL